jgi:hypothetical protein
VLSADGTATVGGVELPSGRRVRATFDEPGGPEVLWRTDEAPRDPLGLWTALALVFPETGLWPLLIEDVRGIDELSRDPDWEAFAGREPEPVLRAMWHDTMPLGEDGEEDEEDEEGVLDPFGHTFPGLGHGAGAAREGRATRTAHGAMEAVDALALVPVRRPADAPAAIGWIGPCNYIDDTGLVSCVLRSWEQRYDAILVGLGDATLTIAVRRPPTGEGALVAAAEQYALCPDTVEQGLGSLRALAKHIDGSPAWAFWWD